MGGSSKMQRRTRGGISRITRKGEGHPGEKEKGAEKRARTKARGGALHQAGVMVFLT